MQPQDQFDRRFDATVEALAAWAATMRDAAEVTTESTATFWRLRLDPRAAGGCPAEVILHRHQTCDWMIGAEAYEGLPLDTLDAIQPLLMAIAAGEAATITTRSAMTNRLVEVSTRVGDADMPIFARARTVSRAAVAGDVTEAKHYLPYRR